MELLDYNGAEIVYGAWYVRVGNNGKMFPDEDESDVWFRMPLAPSKIHHCTRGTPYRCVHYLAAASFNVMECHSDSLVPADRRPRLGAYANFDRP